MLFRNNGHSPQHASIASHDHRGIDLQGWHHSQKNSRGYPSQCLRSRVLSSRGGGGFLRTSAALSQLPGTWASGKQQHHTPNQRAVGMGPALAKAYYSVPGDSGSDETAKMTNSAPGAPFRRQHQSPALPITTSMSRSAQATFRA